MEEEEETFLWLTIFPCQYDLAIVFDGPRKWLMMTALGNHFSRVPAGGFDCKKPNCIFVAQPILRSDRLSVA